jgi:hypothetical protein
MFFDNQVVTTEYEENVQRPDHVLSRIKINYNLKILLDKTKILVFQKRKPVRLEI